MYNTFWHMNLNKDHSIPSGKQLVALLNSMRVHSFDKNEIKRFFYSKANRQKVKINETMKESTEEVKGDSDSGDDPDEGDNSGVEDNVVINVEVDYFIIEISFFS